VALTEFVEPRIRFRFTGEALAGTVYGMVTAMAVIAALAEADANIFYIAAAAISTSLALALTFVYSHWLAGSYADKGHGGSREAWTFELPTLIGPIFLALVMAITRLSGASGVVAAESTMWVGTAALFVLGFRIAQHGGRSRKQAFAFGLLDSAIGASLVLAKVLIH
jgi:hypothetical protein